MCHRLRLRRTWWAARAGGTPGSIRRRHPPRAAVSMARRALGVYGRNGAPCRPSTRRPRCTISSAALVAPRLAQMLTTLSSGSSGVSSGRCHREWGWHRAGQVWSVSSHVSGGGAAAGLPRCLSGTVVSGGLGDRHESHRVLRCATPCPPSPAREQLRAVTGSTTLCCLPVWAGGVTSGVAQPSVSLSSPSSSETL